MRSVPDLITELAWKRSDDWLARVAPYRHRKATDVQDD